MGYSSYQKNKPYRLVEQKIALTRLYPEASCYIKNNTLFWYAKIRPTALSTEYSIRLEYKLGKHPKIILYGDNIKKIDDNSFPHHYKINTEQNTVELCLYYKKEFDGYCLISDTIVPWTVEWLYHYEIWLVTGVWNGGGVH